MSGGLAVMEPIKRRVSYDALKTIVDVPVCFSGKDVEISISPIDDNDSDAEYIYNELRGCIKHGISLEEARAERLDKKRESID